MRKDNVTALNLRKDEEEEKRGKEGGKRRRWGGVSGWSVSPGAQQNSGPLSVITPYPIIQMTRKLDSYAFMNEPIIDNYNSRVRRATK